MRLRFVIWRRGQQLLLDCSGGLAFASVAACAPSPGSLPAASLLPLVRPWPLAGWCECPAWCECKTCHPSEELEFEPVVYEGGKKVAQVKPRLRVS